jgi:predicted RecA/RadA family phage recombinase
MKNKIQPGNVLTLTAPRTLTSGAGFLVGSIFAIATSAAASGASVEGDTVGVFDHPKAAGAATQGQLAYWDNTAFVFTTSAASGANKLIGAFTQAAASGDATGRVKLTGQLS